MRRTESGVRGFISLSQGRKPHLYLFTTALLLTWPNLSARIPCSLNQWTFNILWQENLGHGSWATKATAIPSPFAIYRDSGKKKKHIHINTTNLITFIIHPFNSGWFLLFWKEAAPFKSICKLYVIDVQLFLSTRKHKERNKKVIIPPLPEQFVTICCSHLSKACQDFKILVFILLR